MQIQLCDIWTSDEPYRMLIDNAIMEVINKSSFIGGVYVRSFEENFAKYVGVNHCVGLSSCTAALHLAIESLEIKGKILVPSMTVTADAEAVIQAGCIPVFYDDLESISILPPDIKAIIVVHLYGKPVNMDRVTKIARENSLFVIEDCAQSTGAKFNGRMTGTFGDVSCFSFFPTKILGCYGDGGALLTDSDILADRVSALRNHGRIRGEKHKHHYSGYNYRLDALQAAILDVKLRYLDELIAKRRSAAEMYNKLLLNKYIDRTQIEGYEESVFYVYPIFVENRDLLQKYLKKHGIGTGLHYPIPVHRQPAFEKYCNANLLGADYIANHEISLPMYPGISNDQIEYVCRKIEGFYETQKKVS